jgi:tyrosyl-tRNA synthetase
MKNILDDLRWRGLVHQATDDTLLLDHLREGCKTLYAGFDPTAESLHVGSLMPLLMLRRFQKAGHRPIAVVGGSTGMIGDPSGKSEERNLLSPAILARNLQGIERQLRQFLDFDAGDRSAVVVNNYDWTQPMSYLDFLREIGKHAPIRTMLGKDSVKLRLEREDGGLSYTEFSYMLLQAFDFVHLFQEHGCTLQVGGSDQWGNITAGIELARRMHGAHLHGLTCPLLTKSDGSKMGKTESGAVWLSPDRTSPFQFYQYWFNVADEDAGKCLRFLTELNHDTIMSLDEARNSNPGARESQRTLAEELTKLVHGEQGLSKAMQATQVLFGAEVTGFTDQDLAGIFSDVPSKTLASSLLHGDGLNIVDALVSSEIVPSKSEARRTIQQGGAYLNNRKVDDVNLKLSPAHLASATTMVLRTGKKKYALLRFVD